MKWFGEYGGQYLKKILLVLLAVLILALIPATGVLAASTRVPGHNTDRYDQDNNGYPDAGVYVNGHYTSLYVEDANGDYYWDLGDGRIYTSSAEIDSIDTSVRAKCLLNPPPTSKLSTSL